MTRSLPAVGDGEALARVRRARRRLDTAAAKAEAARVEYEQALADAQTSGYSVRSLADLLDLQPTTVQRLIASAKTD